MNSKHRTIQDYTILTPDDVKYFAAKAGVTMGQVCARAEISHSTFTRWRCGETEPTLAVYRRICDALKEVETKTVDVKLRQRTDGLQQAIRAAGGIRKLAKLLDISPQAVSNWHTVPINRLIAVEAVTGVPREVLRPDLFRLKLVCPT